MKQMRRSCPRKNNSMSALYECPMRTRKDSRPFLRTIMIRTPNSSLTRIISISSLKKTTIITMKGAARHRTKETAVQCIAENGKTYSVISNSKKSMSYFDFWRGRYANTCSKLNLYLNERQKASIAFIRVCLCITAPKCIKLSHVKSIRYKDTISKWCSHN